jgi:acetyl esterase/lipase
MSLSKFFDRRRGSGTFHPACSPFRALGALGALAVLFALAACEVPDPAAGDTLGNEWTSPAELVATDVAYGAHPRQRLDVYAPQSGIPAHGGAIVWIHGGGWLAGDKESVTTSGIVALDLARDGWIVVSIDYRLAGPADEGGDMAIFPEPLQDAKQAIRWLKANARRYGIDPARIVVAGDSAGGHLAAMVALTAGTFEPSGLTGSLRRQNSSVRSWVVFNPAVDLGAMLADTHDIGFGLTPRDAVRAVLGCGARGQRACTGAMLRAASPATYVDRGDPPGYVAVGSDDTVTPPPLHGIALYRAVLNVLGDQSIALDVMDSGPAPTRTHGGFSRGVNRAALGAWLAMVT